MRTTRLLAIPALALLAACGPKITYDLDRSVVIPRGAKVAFLGGTSEGPSRVDPNVQNDIVHRRVQNAIVQELRSKGYQIVDSIAGPDFIVRYFAGIHQNTPLVTTTTGNCVSTAWRTVVPSTVLPSKGCSSLCSGPPKRRPRPAAVMVCPAAESRWSSDCGPSSGIGSMRRRSRA